MEIGVMTVEFRLAGCRSLKDKRRALSGLRDRFGRQPNLAVCESDYQNELRRAQWSFVAIGATGALVDQTLDSVEEKLELVDAEIAGIERERL